MRFSPIYYPGRDAWITSEPHHRLWKKAEELGAIFNYFIAADQLAKLEVMLARHPGVKIVIDHLARVDLSKPDPAAEVAKLTRLAKYPNVWVKVSELSVISLSKDYPYNDTFPWVRRVYDAFGGDRLLYGTGFPGATRAEAGRPSIEQELALIDHEIPFICARRSREDNGPERRRALETNLLSRDYLPFLHGLQVSGGRTNAGYRDTTAEEIGLIWARGSR